MEFGKLPSVAGLDLALPQDGNHLNAEGLPASAAPAQISQNSCFWVGCPVFAQRDFCGPIYPEKTPANRYLKAYGEHYNTVELNASFYHPPALDTVAKWCDMVPETFRFCVKAPKDLSHAWQHPNPELIQYMGSVMRAFGKRLGLVFVQMPPDAGPTGPCAHAIQKMCTSLAAYGPVAVELRHPGWFEDEEMMLRWQRWLAKLGIGLVLSDTAGRRDVLHMARTAPFSMIRFVGNRLDPTDWPRLDQWRARLVQWQQQGTQNIYFIGHQTDERMAAAQMAWILDRLQPNLNMPGRFGPMPTEWLPLPQYFQDWLDARKRAPQDAAGDSRQMSIFAA